MSVAFALHAPSEACLAEDIGVEEIQETNDEDSVDAHRR